MGIPVKRISLMAQLSALAGVLALPLVFLLFAQWPLREWVQAYSRQANDAAQVIFALYMAVAVSAATAGRAHLAAPSLPSAHGRRPAWHSWALLLCILPWSLFMLWAAWPLVANSVAALERFGETLTPGYFLIKLSLVLMLILVLAESAGATVFSSPRSTRA
jgi:hypothetical protein